MNLHGMYLSNSFGPRERARVASSSYGGWLVSPATYGIPRGIKDGQPWAGDNGCFTEVWTEQIFIDWLHLMRDYRETCLFMVAPDVLGDWQATLERWNYWGSIIRFAGFPPAYVGQDGQPSESVPWERIACYFVGGTDDWKDSADSLELVREARRRGGRVHLGRGNTRPRLTAFFKAYRLPGDPESLPGFTFDGNGIRMPGKDRELAGAMAILKMESML